MNGCRLFVQRRADKEEMKLTSAISPPPRKQRPARLVAAAARVAVAAVLSAVNWTSSGFNSLKVIIVPDPLQRFSVLHICSWIIKRKNPFPESTCKPPHNQGAAGQGAQQVWRRQSPEFDSN